MIQRVVCWIVIVVSLLHAVHVAGIGYGEITDLNGSRFFSFAALDRLASAGLIGKFVVLAFDAAVLALAAMVLAGRFEKSVSSKRRKSIR